MDAGEPGVPSWDLSDRFAVFYRDIRRLRASGHEISNDHAYDLFMRSVAALEFSALLRRLNARA